MNWKNITLEAGFIKQEINLNGSNAVNYIPVNQIDSFGVVSSENKRWLYAAIFMGVVTLMLVFAQQLQPTIFSGMIAAGLACVYFLTRKTWFSITSSQTKFSVEIATSKEEIQAVNAFVMVIKESIHSTRVGEFSKAA